MEHKLPKSLIEAAQGAVGQLRDIRDKDNNSTITYKFQEETSYLDFKGSPTNTPVKVYEKGKLEWMQVQKLNKDIFYNHDGKKRDLIELARSLAETAWDLGAYSFEL